jgi:hypothetical protein
LGTECVCFEWRNDCVCHVKTWWLDMDPKLAARGIIVPCFRGELIASLLVLRHATDWRPFKVRLRKAA